MSTHNSFLTPDMQLNLRHVTKLGIDLSKSDRIVNGKSQ